MKIGFLFNHEGQHQVAHTAPIIGELMKLDPSLEISVLTSSEALEARARSMVPEGTEFKRLRPGRLAAGIDRLLGRMAPIGRVSALARNLETFGKLDALVVPETTSALLRTRFRLADLKLIYLPHGSGDRSVGFREVTSVFDLVLLAGQKVRDRMLATGIIRPDGHAIVGYPKFDTVVLDDRPRFFGDDKPVVLYNPHFDPLLSSWFDMGQKLIDWFAGQPSYNLIAAPHVMLFQRRLHASVEHRRMRVRKAIDHPDSASVRIDTGSDRSVDMSYTRGADIYIGDASSQIYEWIARPRPAIFLNPHRLKWKGDPNFAHWALGDVIEDLSELTGALERAANDPDRYKDAQREAFENTFSLTGEPSSRRAAKAILDFLRR